MVGEGSSAADKAEPIKISPGCVQWIPFRWARGLRHGFQAARCCLSPELFSLSSESFSHFPEPFSLSLTKGRPHSHSVGRVCCELGMLPVILPHCTHCTSLLATKLPLAILWVFCHGFIWERPSGKGCGSQGMRLVQTMDFPVTHQDGSALLLLSGCSRCSSGLLQHHSLLPLFRGIIPAQLVRASEDRMDVA